MLEKYRLSNEYVEGLVSAVIITYKQGDYLFDTIQSILFQNYPCIELIIADDGSPCFDEEKIKQYIHTNAADNIKSVKILHKIHSEERKKESPPKNDLDTLLMFER